MYLVRYTNKKGGSCMATFGTIEQLENKAASLLKQRIEARIYKDGELIGRVWRDDSQQFKWSYSIETN